MQKNQNDIQPPKGTTKKSDEETTEKILDKLLDQHFSKFLKKKKYSVDDSALKSDIYHRKIY